MFKKLIFPFALFALTFVSCTKQVEEPAPPIETWHMKLVVHFADGSKVFELDTENVGRLVGNYDPTTGQNPQVGKTLNFASRLQDFACTCYFHFETNTVDRIDGTYNRKAFGNVLNTINPDGTTALNFCNGPQKVPAELFVVRTQ